MENYTYSEHEVSIMIPALSDQARPGLIKALEKLDYLVLEEQPLCARRNARGGGVSGTSVNVLDYQINLKIYLRTNEEKTLATFIYQICNPLIGKGDKQTLTREAEAICALLKAQTQALVCRVCHIEVLADSRFCRRCGNPVDNPEPVELELLRLTAESQVAFEYVRYGAIFVSIALGCLLISLIPDLKPKLVSVLQIMGLVFTPTVFMLFWAAKKLNEAINKRGINVGVTSKSFNSLPASSANTLEARPITKELYDFTEKPAPVSVTENTTDILNQDARVKERAYVRNTGKIH